MEIFVPRDQVKEIFDVLAGEKVSCEVTDKEFDLVVAGEKIGEVTALKADLVETDVPVIYDEGPRDNAQGLPVAFREESPPHRRRRQFRPHRRPAAGLGTVAGLFVKCKEPGGPVQHCRALALGLAGSILPLRVRVMLCQGSTSRSNSSAEKSPASGPLLLGSGPRRWPGGRSRRPCRSR